MLFKDLPEPTLDLGDNHLLRFSRHGGDVVGATEEHLRPDGKSCLGHFYFDLPETRDLLAGQDRPMWTVQSWNPLTLTPSLVCQDCGDHGFVREGKWVPA